MDDELVLYTHPMSRGRTVRWMLEEVARPYRTQLLDYAKEMKAPEFLRLNPMGKVPVLRHGTTVVTEVAAICTYLADAFPDAGLAPHGRDRGPYYRWLFFAAGPIEAAATNAALGLHPPVERRRMVGYGSLDDVLRTMEATLGEVDYLAGDRFTAADLVLGSQLGWGMMFGTIEKRPVFERYWDRLAGRAAAKRARALDDALLSPKPPDTPAVPPAAGA